MFRLMAKGGHASEGDPRCSVCDKAEPEIRKLIAGPKFYICDECVRVCQIIIEEDSVIGMSAEKNNPSINALPVSCSLCGLPTSPDGVLFVENKGVLCPLCVRDVQSAIEERDERHPTS